MLTNKPRIVFDTNALLSALILPSSVSGKAWRIGLLNFEVVTSAAVMEEFERKTNKQGLKKYLPTEAERIETAGTMARSMLYVEIESVIGDCDDDDDNKFLALAFDSRAVVIVSGDRDLKILDPWRKIRILGTGDFVRQFNAGTLFDKAKRL